MLADSEEKLRSLVELSADGIMIMDTQAEIVEWNPAMTRITRVSREHAEGHKLWDVLITLIPPSERTEERLQAMRQRCREVIERLPTMQAEVLEQRDIVVGDEEVVTVQQTQFPIRARSAQYLGTITRDVTETVRLQESLRQNEKMAAIGELAGGIAHDFNNQLAGIMGYADLLRLAVRHDERSLFFVEQVL